MARQPSLRSQLNQIRSWVRQGRTNAWIAHQLDITIDQIERFKREHELEEVEQSTAPPADPLSVPAPEPAEHVQEEDEEEEAEEEEAEAQEREGVEPAQSTSGSRRGPRRGSRGGRGRSRRSESTQREPQREPQRESQRESAERAQSADSRKPRRRGRRGGRRRSKTPQYEATFDHGEEGYGLWLDPAVVDNPVYAEHWAGHRAVVARIDEDSITIRRDGGAPRGGGQ